MLIVEIAATYIPVFMFALDMSFFIGLCRYVDILKAEFNTIAERIEKNSKIKSGQRGQSNSHIKNVLITDLEFHLEVLE